MFLFHTSPYVFLIWKKSTNSVSSKQKTVNTNREREQEKGQNELLHV